MTFQDSIKSCFNKYGSINGRATRSEYWYWTLFVILVSVFTLIIDVSLLGSSIDDEFTPLNSIWSLAVFIPGITVTVRRFHDVNRSGWWILIILTVIGIIPYIYWLVKGSDATENSFGPSSLSYQ
mgnify:FL=1|tara:strand:- start:60 stop:434 length:375 start_codon:yes stop_codon:yes gene_type:complete